MRLNAASRCWHFQNPVTSLCRAKLTLYTLSTLWFRCACWHPVLSWSEDGRWQGARKDDAKRQAKEKAAAAEKLKAAEAAAARARDALAAAQAGAKDRDAALDAAQEALADQKAACAAKDVEVARRTGPALDSPCPPFVQLLVMLMGPCLLLDTEVKMPCVSAATTWPQHAALA